MKKELLIVLIFTFAAIFISCDSAKSTGNTNSTEPAEVKKDAKPLADDEIAVLEMENSAAFGTIKIELYSNIAPKWLLVLKSWQKREFIMARHFIG